MGALTVLNRKRFDYSNSSSSFNFNTPSFSPAYSDRRGIGDDTHISKKAKVSVPPYMKQQLIPDPPLSSKSVAARVSWYPEPKGPIKRAVHAPCRPSSSKFGFATSSSGIISSRRLEGVGNPTQSESDTMGILAGKYAMAKSCAMDTLHFLKKDDKGMIDVEGETFQDDDDLQILEDGPEGILKETSDDGAGNVSAVMELDADDDRKVVAADPKNVVSDLTANLKDLGVSPHKKLLDSAESRNPKLSKLQFEIKLNLARLAKFQSLRPKQKPQQVVVREPFVALTEEEEADVDRAFSYSNRRKTLVTHKNSNIEITGELLQCLKPGAWLNDEVINLYLELLKEREKREPQQFLKCHFFNTFFYKKLTASGYGSVRRWTSQRKLGYCLLDCDKIFVPIHKEVHWCLGVINKKEKKFQYLDSLKGGDSQVMKFLAKYFVDEVKDKTGKDIDVSSWDREFVEDLPEQKNGFDCGVFMIKYADFYSRDVGLCFNQGHMPYFRKRTAKEILRLKAD